MQYLYLLEMLEKTYAVFLRTLPLVFMLSPAIYFAAYKFHQSRSLAFLLTTAGVMVTVFALYPLVLVFKTLGYDSVLESVHFDPIEAASWLSTISFSTDPRVLMVVQATALGAILFTIVLIYVLARMLPRRKLNLGGISILIAVISLSYVSYNTLHAYYQGWQETREFAGKIHSKTKEIIPQVTVSDASVASPGKLIVYIGESTNRQHWSLFGYPRNTNGPLLKFADRFILFADVLSTHSHTFPSLVAALTLQNEALPGSFENPGANLVQILQSFGVEVTWLSTQGHLGSSNLVASQLAVAASQAHFFAESYIDYLHISRYESDSRLNEELKAMDWYSSTGSRVAFLHSYAGHGRRFCFPLPPAFRAPVDQYFQSLSNAAIFGSDHSVANAREELECYDSAMSFISRNLADLMADIDVSPEPTLLLYFADHGEDVYGSTYHDSSNHRHGHITLPLLFFGNRALEKKSPEFFDVLRKNSHKPWLLSDIPATLMDLYALKIPRLSGVSLLSNAADTRSRVVLRRQLLDGRNSHIIFPGIGETGADLQARKAMGAESQLEAIKENDRQLRALGARGCVHRTNSISRAIRGSFTVGCIEADILLLDGNSSPMVTHDSDRPTNFTLPMLLDIVAGYGGSLWLDVKDFKAGNCHKLVAELALADTENIEKILVEFSTVVGADDGVVKCAGELRERGFETSYYLPTNGCLKAVPSCEKNRAKLRRQLASGAFDAISFDKNLLGEVMSMEELRQYPWHTWGYDIYSLPPQPERYGFVIYYHHTEGFF